MTTTETKYYFTKKELAAAMGRSTWFVRCMELGGFMLPASIEEAVFFIRENPFPSRIRKEIKTKHGKQR